eukprot:gene4956-biopygen7465
MPPVFFLQTTSVLSFPGLAGPAGGAPVFPFRQHGPVFPDNVLAGFFSGRLTVPRGRAGGGARQRRGGGGGDGAGQHGGRRRRRASRVHVAHVESERAAADQRACAEEAYQGEPEVRPREPPRAAPRDEVR